MNQSPLVPTHLLHLHIPKTAGTSVRRLLADAFGATLLHPERFAAFSLWPQEVTRSFRIVSAHMGLDQRALLPDPLTIMTGLRDPICRFLSFYRHAKSLADDSNVFSFMFNRYSLRDLLSERFEPFLKHTGNTATQYLSGIKLGDDLSWTRDARMIDHAMQNLAGIEHVYLFEAFAQTMAGILDRLGGSAAVGTMPFDNVGIHDAVLFDRFSADDMRRLRGLLHADYALYDAAYQRFLSKYPLGSTHDLTPAAPALVERVGQHEVILSQPGGAECFAFGPYVNLPHGEYRVRFFIEFMEAPSNSGEAALRLDVARNRGQGILAQTTLRQTAAGGWVQREVELAFVLASPQLDVEFRALVSPRCRAGLRRTVHLRRIAF